MVPGPRKLALVLVCVAPWAQAQGMVVLRDPRRPPDLGDQPGCALWVGRLTGNDPTGEAQLKLCARGPTHVDGEFQWSSLQSGWDRRALEGDWNAEHTELTLHDTRMLESHPAEGWTLCVAERYTLRPGGTGVLLGGFWSEACQDHGTLTLQFSREVPDPVVPARPRLELHRPPDSLARRPRRLRCDGRPPAPGRVPPVAVALGSFALALCARRRGRVLSPRAAGSTMPRCAR